MRTLVNKLVKFFKHDERGWAHAWEENGVKYELLISFVGGTNSEVDVVVLREGKPLFEALPLSVKSLEQKEQNIEFVKKSKNYFKFKRS